VPLVATVAVKVTETPRFAGFRLETRVVVVEETVKPAQLVSKFAPLTEPRPVTSS